MKTGRSLQEIAAELERQTNTQKDYVAPQGAVQAVVDQEDGNTVKLAGFNGAAMPIKPFAHQQLADVLGIPKRYYDRMAAEQPGLLATNINGWLQADPTNRRMLRTLDGQVRAVVSPKFRPLDNYPLARVVLPKLLNINAQVMSCELTETRMYIKAILPDLSDTLPDGMAWGNGHNAIAEYRGNEPGKVVAAITISNSDVGAGTLRVEPGVFTTWCTNLAVLKAAAMRKYHVGRSFEADQNWEVFKDATREADDRAFWLKVEDVTAAAFDVEIFRAAVAQIREAAEQPIESKELPAVVEVAVNRLALPPAAGNDILTFLARGGDMSKWGLSSAISATANNVKDYEMATTLERASGEVLAMNAREWAPIAQATA
jgi:hypothetical protein